MSEIANAAFLAPMPCIKELTMRKVWAGEHLKRRNVLFFLDTNSATTGTAFCFVLFGAQRPEPTPDKKVDRLWRLWRLI